MITLEKQDLDKLLAANDRAASMPVMAMSLGDGLSGNDFASSARKSLVDVWKELGTKYNFDPGSVKGINRKTGEVLV